MQIGAYRFDRMELAGSLGDLGTLLPIAMGLILGNGISPAGLFFSVGTFYIIAGAYFRVPIAVQPMKVIGAYAIATTASALQIQAAGLLMAVVLAAMAAARPMDAIMRAIPRGVVRGVQLSTGVLLATRGIAFIAGSTSFQALVGKSEPYLALQSIAGLPLGIVLGIVFSLVTLRYLNSRTLPAGLMVVAGGMLLGFAMGASKELEGVTLGFGIPPLMPYGWPSWADLSLAFVVMVLPQTPMTIGNAVLANMDLSQQYFPEGSRRMTSRALCASMAAANLFSVAFGGMPLCHGAGGLAAHYRFGARTAGSNIIIGAFFLFLAVVLGDKAPGMVRLLPLSVMGVMLVFAGLQLCSTIGDLPLAGAQDGKRHLFVALLMLVLTLAGNLALAFCVGVALDWAVRREWLSL